MGAPAAREVGSGIVSHWTTCCISCAYPRHTAHPPIHVDMSGWRKKMLHHQSCFTILFSHCKLLNTCSNLSHYYDQCQGKGKNDLPPFVSERKTRLFFRPHGAMHYCADFSPQLGGAKISSYGCTGMGCCCIGLSSPFPPTYSCTCACLYAYVCAAKATAA